MSISMVHSNGQSLREKSPRSLTDSEWLQTLNFRNSVSNELKDVATEGNVAAFSEALLSTASVSRGEGKGTRKKIVASLAALREEAPESCAFTHALLESGLKRAERSAHVAAFIAENAEDVPENHTLCDALWMLSIYREKLEPEELFALWRWSLQSGQNWMSARPVCDPEQGFSQLRHMEICYLMAVTFQDLQGSHKLLKETTGLIRNCIEESTDTDGTPQPQWVPELVETLSTLARLTLFANWTGQKLWNETFQQRLDGLLSRTASLCAGGHLSFASRGEPVETEKLAVIASILSTDSGEGLSRYFISQHQGKRPSQKSISGWSLPDEVHQSDWAKLACLRSGWKSPVDQCVVLYDAASPQLDLVVADHPLFQGNWRHELELDGQLVECPTDWTCSCWFADAEVNFLELIQEVDSSTRVVRQVIFVRDQQLLLLNHAVHAQGASKITYRASLPFHGTWESEVDSTTRELSLQAAGQRVRMYPLSLSQDRVIKADGQVLVTEQYFTVEQHSDREKLFVSTMFDWSLKRRSKSVDWNRLAVAQDGKLEGAAQAAAYRCRVGREQWLLYHSLTTPEIPRTVIGLHTPHETVFSRFTTQGTIEPIVEVEMSS